MRWRAVVPLGMLAVMAGCSRGPRREPATPDTLSLAPLADSSAAEELRGEGGRIRTDSQPGQVAAPPRPKMPARRKHAVPTRRQSTSRPADTAQGYRPSAEPSDSGRVATDSSTASSRVDSTKAEPAAKPDTAIDARTAVGDSVFRSTTPAPSPTPAPPPASAGPTPATAATPAAPIPSPAAGTYSPPARADSAGHGRAAANALPAGTQIRAMLSDSINSLRNSVGQTVTATVSGDLRAPDGLAVLPTGAVVHLTIDRLSPARSRSAKDGELVLKADSVTAAGHTYRVNATVQPVPHELKGRGVTAGEVEKVGAGAAAGAVVGGVVTGKTKGAVVGGAVGAVGGAVVAAQTASRDVIVTPRTLITLILRSPIARAE
jgi:hypothetical protein